MSTSLLCSALAALTLAQAPPERPRSRDAAESHEANLARYRLDVPDQNPGGTAGPSLGVNVLYPDAAPQGVAVAAFADGSPAWNAGLRPGDLILEVNGSPVGLLRGRHYQPRNAADPGTGPADLLVSYTDEATLAPRFYYVAPFGGPNGTDRGGLAPSDLDTRPTYFARRRPADRFGAETLVENVARYQVAPVAYQLTPSGPQAAPGGFDRTARYELGAAVAYSPQRGATIVAVKPDGAAERAGLRAGDSILEVDGSPVGQFGGRVYETWRRFDRSPDDTVELLVGFHDESSKQVRYYYPEVRLDPRTSPN